MEIPSEFKKEPVNLLVEIRKIFLFFCLSFVFFFAVFTVGRAFIFLGEQLTVFESQAVVLGEGLPVTPGVLPTSTPDVFPTSTPDVSSSTSGVRAPLKENSLKIQKLEVEVPLIFSKMTEVKEIVKDLLKGAAVYPGSGSPGGEGRMFILGHSSPPGFPKLKYYWVFSKLNDLETGDEIFINFENKQYRYRVTQKMFLAKGQEIPITEDGPLSVIYLITCWPPGQDVRRLAVEAVLTSPAALTN